MRVGSDPFGGYEGYRDFIDGYGMCDVCRKRKATGSYYRFKSNGHEELVVCCDLCHEENNGTTRKVAKPILQSTKYPQLYGGCFQCIHRNAGDDGDPCCACENANGKLTRYEEDARFRHTEMSECPNCGNLSLVRATHSGAMYARKDEIMCTNPECG